MKVLQISSLLYKTPPLGYGGIEQFADDLADCLSTLKTEVYIIRLIGSKGGDYFSFNIKSHFLLKKIKTIVKKIKPDVIHSHIKDEKLIKFLRTLKIPIIFTIHNNIRENSDWIEIMKEPPKNFLFVAVSKNLLDRICQFLSTNKYL